MSSSSMSPKRNSAREKAEAEAKALKSKKTLFVWMAVVGLLGDLLCGFIGTTYESSATIRVANTADIAKFTQYAYDNVTMTAMSQAAGADPQNGKTVSLVQNPSNPSEFSVTGEDSTGFGASSTANEAASELIDEVHKPDLRLGNSFVGPILSATLYKSASPAGASVSDNSMITPALHDLELIIFTLALLTGIVAFAGWQNVLVALKLSKPVPVAKSANARPAAAPVTRPAPTATQAAVPQAVVLPKPAPTTFASQQQQPLPPVHTLVTITRSESSIGTRFETAAPIVFSAGPQSGFSTQEDRIEAPEALVSDVHDDLPLKTNVDAVLFQRLEEYKAYKPNEGCVLLVTETMPADNRSRMSAANMNGAAASLSFARKIAEVRGTPTLLIDTGSKAWSSNKKDPKADDVIDLPPVDGVYDIIASGQGPSDWMLLEDEEIPGYMALAPGQIPSNWLECLRSEGMRTLIKNARSIADLIIIYTPRCVERPEVIRALAAWTNGIMIVSGVDPMAEAAEEQALSMLHGWNATIFGRIALDTNNISPESDSELRAAHRSGQSQATEDFVPDDAYTTSPG